MVKARHKKVITALAIIIFGLVIAYTFLPEATLPRLALFGATPLSCSNDATFISNDEFYSEGSYFCPVVLGTGQKIIVEGIEITKYEETLNPDDFLNIFGVKTAQSAEIEFEVLKDECRYEFMQEPEPVYSYIIETHKVKENNVWSCGFASITERNRFMQRGRFIGNTPIVCKKGVCSQNLAGTTGYESGCEYVLEVTEGVVHRLDPSQFYDFEARITMTLEDGTEYETTISQENQADFTEGFRAVLLGEFLGQQSCPSQPNTVAYVKNVFEAQPVGYKSKFLADAVITDQLSIVDAYTAVNKKNSHSILLNNFINSDANAGQYCEIAAPTVTSIQEARMNCDPTGTVTVPVIGLYFNAETVGQFIPSGKPVITNVEVEKVYAAEKSDIAVTVRNEGDDDCFEASLQGKLDPEPFSTKDCINEGETKEINIAYEGAGIIGEFTAEVISINSPQNMDSEILTLNIKPYCPRTPPSSNHLEVFTQKGCAYICPNYVTEDGIKVDVYNDNCQPIESYDRCVYEFIDTEVESVDDEGNPINITIQTRECVSKKSFTGIHCTGIGTYMLTDRYLDKAANDLSAIFVPEPREKQYFIVSVDGKPVCDYEDEYGYSNGNPISEQFYYEEGLNAIEFEQAEEEFFTGTTPASAPGGVQVPGVSTEEDDFNSLFLMLGVAVVLAIGAWKFV